MEEGKSAIALVDGVSGRAYVIEPDGRTFTIEAERSKPQDAKGLNVGMYLQPAMTTIEERDAGEYPYRGLHEYLVLAQNRERAFLLFFTILDTSMPDDFRKEEWEELEAMLLDDNTRQALRRRVLSRPLPKGTALPGFVSKMSRTAELALEMIEGREALQQIEAAWIDAITHFPTMLPDGVQTFLVLEGGFASIFDSIRSHAIAPYLKWKRSVASNRRFGAMEAIAADNIARMAYRDLPPDFWLRIGTGLEITTSDDQGVAGIILKKEIPE